MGGLSPPPGLHLIPCYLSFTPLLSQVFVPFRFQGFRSLQTGFLAFKIWSRESSLYVISCIGACLRRSRGFRASEGPTRLLGFAAQHSSTSTTEETSDCLTMMETGRFRMCCWFVGRNSWSFLGAYVSDLSDVFGANPGDAENYTGVHRCPALAHRGAAAPRRIFRCAAIEDTCPKR